MVASSQHGAGQVGPLGLDRVLANLDLLAAMPMEAAYMRGAERDKHPSVYTHPCWLGQSHTPASEPQSEPEHRQPRDNTEAYDMQRRMEPMH